MASPRQWRDRLQPHPHLEDGSAYRQLRPTRLDKIKNFHLDLPIGRMILKNVPAAKTLGRGRRPDTGQDRLDFLDAPSVGRGHVPGDYDRRSRH